MKIRSIICLLVAVAAMIGADALAFTVDFGWNIPGAVEIKTSSYLDGTVVGPADDAATSFSYECDASRWVYLVARDGYKITSAEINGKAVNPTVANGRIFVGKYFSGGSRVDVTLAPVARDREITVEVENGADWIFARFNDGYEVTLTNGFNTVGYDPDLETTFSLSPANGATDFYSITLNGTPMTNRYPFNPTYEVSPLKEGDKVKVRVFEDSEPVRKECVVSVKFAPGMEGCVNTIRNWTASSWMTLEDGELTVGNGTDLQFNFNADDYDYTSILLDGTDVTKDLHNSSLRFTVEDDALLEVNGTPKDFGTVEYTVYVKNPEGVTLYCGTYGDNAADLSEGDAIDADVALPAPGGTGEIILTPADTRRFALTLSAKTPNIYVAPREGWYIYTVQAEAGGEMLEMPMLTPDTKEFYVVAMKMEGYRKADINVHGSAPLRLAASSARSSMWNNPASSYEIHEGEQTIEFLPDYDLPLTLRALEHLELFFVYMDGAGLAPDENDSYSLTPWYPAEGEDAAEDVCSHIDVFADGSRPRSGKVKIEATDGLTAEMRYGAVRREGDPAGQTLLEGTEVAVIPSDEDCTITVDGTVVNGLGADGKFIGGLTAQGEYVFTVRPGTTEITISAGCGIVGVEGILDNAIDEHVYTIDGRRFPASADRASLAPGLYIIGGSRVLIR